MKIKQAVPAFTIIEVTVALLLSSIVILIAYTAFTMVHSSYLGFNKRNAITADFLLTDKQLKKDFRSAREIIATAAGFRAVNDSLTIEYTFSSARITRRQGELRTDTIRLEAGAPQLSFEARPCNPGERADALSVTARVNGKELLLQAAKQYSAEQLFN